MAAHYTPSQLIKDFHALPRYGGATNQIPVGVFGAEFTSAAASNPGAALRGSPYLLGALAPGAAMIAAGALVFLIFFTAYCCACCRCCGACRPRPKAAARCTLLSRTTALALLACINLALVLSAISFVPGFAAGLGGIVASMQSVAGLLGSGAALLTSPTPVQVAGAATPSVAAQLGAAGATLGGLATGICASPALQGACGSFTTTGELFTSLSAQAVAPSAQVLSDSSGLLTSTIASWPIASIQRSISLAGLCVLAIISGLLFLQSTLLCRNSCATCGFKFLSFFSLIMAALVYIVAGIFLIVGVLGSDLCWGPYAVLASLAAAVDPTQTLQYYLTCYESAAAPPPLSVPALVLNISASVKEYVSLVNSSLIFPFTQEPQLSIVNSRECPFLPPPPLSLYFRPPLPPSPSRSLSCPRAPTPTPRRARATAAPNGIPFFFENASSIAASLSGTAASLGLLGSSVLSCSALDGAFSTFFAGLCGGAIHSSVAVARVMIAAASLLLLQLSLIVDFSCWHPGDPAAFEEGAGGGKLDVRTPSQAKRSAGQAV
jgi:hypothetical protein